MPKYVLTTKLPAKVNAIKLPDGKVAVEDTRSGETHVITEKQFNDNYTEAPKAPRRERRPAAAAQ